MKYLKTFEKHSIGEDVDVRDTIRNLKKLPKELKDSAIELVGSLTKAGEGKVTGLELHPDLKKKISENDYPSGFSMGVDKDGWFIHTHRGRSKSHETPDNITVKEIKFIDSTG